MGCLTMNVITEVDNGKTIILKSGEALEIRLNENASTGFTWLEEITPNDVLTLEKEDFIQNNLTPGGNTVHQWVYKGKKTGQKRIKFVYQRPWVKDQPAEKEFEIIVRVLD